MASHRRLANLLLTLLTITTACSWLHAQQPQLDVIYEPAADVSYDRLLIEEHLAQEMYPLLTYVFFDSGSAVIPDRYMRFTDPQQTARFSDSTIPGGTLDKYYHVLNIIGYRMRRYPTTTITIAGTNSMQSGIGETMKTAAERGRAVHDYLVNIWRIDPARIRMLAPRDLPPHGDNLVNPLDYIDNRRAEIWSPDWEIMQPVVNRDLRRYPMPDWVSFRMSNGIADSVVARRTIEIRRGDALWHVMNDVGLVDTISPHFNWGRNGNEDSLPGDEMGLTAQLVVYGTDGSEHRSDEVRLPVEIITDDVKIQRGLITETIERYMIPFFEFNEDKLGPLNKRLLREFVCGTIAPGATVEAVGHTDVIGLEESNKRLSEFRARMITRFIKQCAPNVPDVSYNGTGVGEESPLFSNDLQEGRFYNRVVMVTVTTPVHGGE